MYYMTADGGDGHSSLELLPCTTVPVVPYHDINGRFGIAEINLQTFWLGYGITTTAILLSIETGQRPASASCISSAVTRRPSVSTVVGGLASKFVQF